MTQLNPPRTSGINTAALLLGGCMFASGACGVILEYIQAAMASMILGNSFEQWAMVIGLMLFWMGIGSLIQTRIPKGALIYVFIGIETALALAGGFSPTLTYLSFGYTGHFRIVLYGFVSLIGILIGLEIPVIIRINNDYSKELSTNLGHILSADYIGSLVGALIYVYVLLRYFPITEGAFLTAGMNFSLALVTFIYFARKGMVGRPWPIALVMGFTALALFTGFTRGQEWQIKLEQPLYDDPVVYSQTSRYQHIVITRFEPLNETRLFLNGNLQLNSLDEARYHESLVHPVMNLVPRHGRVLILGGGDGCALREILKYPAVESVTLVDLDPAMTQLASTHPLLTAVNDNAFKDARVTTVTGDGLSQGPIKPVRVEAPAPPGQVRFREVASVQVMNIDADLFLSQTSDFYDVIIVDMPDPSSPELVKLYSRGFYGKIRRRLSQTGMMVVQATSPYFAKEAYLCIGRTLGAAGFSILPFHENVPSFGDWGFYLAFHPQLDRKRLEKEMDQMEIPVETRFLTPRVFQRQRIFGKGMLETRRTGVNTLSHPLLLTLYNVESWLLE